MIPVQVDVIMPLPEGWGLCTSCELLMAHANLDQAPAESSLETYPPAWQADLQRLVELLADLTARYGDRVLFRLYDPQSLPGLFKAVRYWARRYPTFIVNGRVKIAGWDSPALQAALATAARPAGQVYPVDVQPPPARWQQKVRQFIVALGQIIYGASVYEMVRDLQKERGQIERLFVVIVFGDLLGVPILPPYYTLRLLPYVLPSLPGWRTSLLRERDLTDLCDQDFT